MTAKRKTTKKPATKVPVVFRMIDKQVEAIFPTEPGTNDPSTCTFFDRSSGHASGDCYRYAKRGRPATPKEYAETKRALEGPQYGYKLAVVPKITRAHHAARRRQLGIKR